MLSHPLARSSIPIVPIPIVPIPIVPIPIVLIPIVLIPIVPLPSRSETCLRPSSLLQIKLHLGSPTAAPPAAARYLTLPGMMVPQSTNERFVSMRKVDAVVWRSA